MKIFPPLRKLDKRGPDALATKAAQRMARPHGHYRSWPNSRAAMDRMVARCFTAAASVTGPN